MTAYHQLRTLLEEKILILDGGMGTLIQSYQLEEKDFRGERFESHPCDVKGNISCRKILVTGLGILLNLA